MNHRSSIRPMLPWPFEGERRQAFLQRYAEDREVKRMYPLAIPRGLAAERAWNEAFDSDRTTVSVHMDGDTYLIYGSKTERYERG